MTLDPDTHTFSVVLVRDFVKVQCEACEWYTGYQMNDQRMRRLVKEAALLHRAEAAKGEE